MHAELTLSSAQVQKGLYERLLADKSKEAEHLSYELQALQPEKKCMEDRLEDVRSQLEGARHELCILQVGSSTERARATASKMEAKLDHACPLDSTPYASELWSHPPISSVGRRKLPQTPVLTGMKSSSIVPLAIESPVTPSVSEKVNSRVPSVSMVNSTSGTV